jgi:hypothetical protein
MKTKIVILLHLLALPISLFSDDENKPLSCTLKPLKTCYEVGKIVPFKIILKNIGNTPLHVVQINEEKNGHRYHLNWEPETNDKFPSPFTCECISEPFFGALEDTILLNINETYEFTFYYIIREGHLLYPIASVSYFVAPYSCSEYYKEPDWVKSIKETAPLWQGYSKRIQIGAKFMIIGIVTKDLNNMPGGNYGRQM